MSRKPLDLSGQKQPNGQLTAVRRSGKRGNCYLWECLCSCGKRTTVSGTYFKNGTVRRCPDCTREYRRKNPPRNQFHAQAESRQQRYQAMREGGMSLRDIAAADGISRQAVWAVLNRKPKEMI
jgi:hypothetical protein